MRSPRPSIDPARIPRVWWRAALCWLLRRHRRRDAFEQVGQLHAKGYRSVRFHVCRFGCGTMAVPASTPRLRGEDVAASRRTTS